MTRVRKTALVIAGCAFLICLGQTMLAWGSPARFVKVDVIGGVLVVLCALAIVIVTVGRAGPRRLPRMSS